MYFLFFYLILFASHYGMENNYHNVGKLLMLLKDFSDLRKLVNAEKIKNACFKPKAG